MQDAKTLSKEGTKSDEWNTRYMIFRSKHKTLGRSTKRKQMK